MEELNWSLFWAAADCRRTNESPAVCTGVSVCAFGNKCEWRLRCVEAFDGAPKSSWMMIFCWLFFFFDLLFGRVLIRCCWGALPSSTFYINIFIYGCGSGSRLSLDSRSSGGGRPHRRPIGIRSISALTMTLSSDARDARATLHTKNARKITCALR